MHLAVVVIRGSSPQRKVAHAMNALLAVFQMRIRELAKSAPLGNMPRLAMHLAVVAMQVSLLLLDLGTVASATRATTQGLRAQCVHHV